MATRGKKRCIKNDCECQDNIDTRHRFINTCLKSRERICTVCGITKNFNDFVQCKRTNLGILQTCKSCNLIRVKKYFNANKKEVYKRTAIYNKKFQDLRVKTLGNIKCKYGCQICGYSRCPKAIEFHHIDPKDKKYCIGHEIRQLRYDKLFSEIAKCILVCSICHTEIEFGMLDASNVEKCKITREEYDIEFSRLRATEWPD